MTSKFDDIDTMSLPPDSPRRDDPFESLVTQPIKFGYRVIRQENSNDKLTTTPLVPHSEEREKWKKLDEEKIDCSKAVNLFVNIPESLVVDHAIEKRIEGKLLIFLSNLFLSFYFVQLKEVLISISKLYFAKGSPYL